VLHASAEKCWAAHTKAFDTGVSTQRSAESIPVWSMPLETLYRQQGSRSTNPQSERRWIRFTSPRHCGRSPKTPSTGVPSLASFTTPATHCRYATCVCSPELSSKTPHGQTAAMCWRRAAMSAASGTAEAPMRQGSLAEAATGASSRVDRTRRRRGMAGE